MHLDLLLPFFAVVEHGSLNKAAAHLRVSDLIVDGQHGKMSTPVRVTLEAPSAGTTH